MSADHYKAEAKRLAAHLVDTHGIKLKHASVLEAIAALHGARDWNTLLASGQPGLVRRVATALLPKGKTSFQPVRRYEDFLYCEPCPTTFLGTDFDCTRAVELTNQNLRNHILVLGQQGQGASQLMVSLALQQIARSGGLLFIDPLGAPDTQAALAQAMAQAQRTDFQALSEAPGSDRYDLFEGDSDHVVDRLLCLLPAQESEPVRLRALLLAVIVAQVTAFQPRTVQALHRVLTNPQELLKLRDAVSDLGEIRDMLQAALLDVLRRTKDGERIDLAAYRDLVGDFPERLSAFWQSDAGKVLGEGSQCVKMRQVFARSGVVYLGLPAMADQSAVAILANMLRLDLQNATRVFTPPQALLQVAPFMLMVSHVGAVADRRWAALPNWARMLGLVMVLHDTSVEDLQRTGDRFTEAVLYNTANKVFFQAGSPRAHAAALGLLQACGGSNVNGSDWSHRLASLVRGRALYLREGAVQDLLCGVVTLS